jgi:beta-lactamase regulating signal transducer with metallopeptidase domain
MSWTMASSLTPLVLQAALFASLAIVLLLATRTLLRRQLGASTAYQAWLLVPLVVLATLLPQRSAPQILHIEALRPVHALALQAAPNAFPQQANMLLWVWACGAVAAALWFAASHHAFLRRAGRLIREGDVHIGAPGVGPASLGLLRPRIVVPPDFAQRYSPQEQALVLAHERTHIARRDALANLAAAMFQCVFWFNPLVHLGARAFRQDQELACDAAVMRRHPGQRRAYAEALLKSHTGAHAAAGLHCYWQSPHPTKKFDSSRCLNG